jgi:hypothetical protein
MTLAPIGVIIHSLSTATSAEDHSRSGKDALMTLSVSPAHYGALISVMLCSGGGIICAQHVRVNKKDHRLFVSLILFALNWAILLPYYALQTDNQPSDIVNVRNFLPAYSGVLMLFAGGALLREAVDRKKEKDNEIGTYDALALVCLSLLVAPHLVAFAPPAVAESIEHALVIILQPFLTVAGFSSIVIGLRILTKDNELVGLWWTFLVIASLYASADVWFSVILFGRTVVFHLPYHMPDPFKWLFAICKLAFSGTFFAIVLRQTYDRYKSRVKSRAVAARCFNSNTIALGLKRAGSGAINPISHTVSPPAPTPLTASGVAKRPQVIVPPQLFAGDSY